MAEGEPELLGAVARIVAAFDALGVDYLVGGSVASGVFGEGRLPRLYEPLALAESLERSEFQPLRPFSGDLFEHHIPNTPGFSRNPIQFARPCVSADPNGFG